MLGIFFAHILDNLRCLLYNNKRYITNVMERKDIMPPKAKITREEIIATAVELVRQNGESALNARNIAHSLGCSTQPIFSNFSNMDELRAAVKEAADTMYRNYLATDMSAGKFPPYKASGMAYIRFAREEKELFKLLFMCDRSHETVRDDRESIRPIIEIIKKNLGLDEEKAYFFHMEMWVYVHGIATMIATSYLNWDDEMISSIVTDAYEGLKKRYLEVSHAGDIN